MPALENPKHEKFVQTYLTEGEFFGNGTQSYCVAYGIDSSDPKKYKVAGAAATRLLKKVSVIARIQELLQEGGFNKENVFKNLLFLINQKGDLGASYKASELFIKLEGLLTQKIEQTNKIALEDFDASKLTGEERKTLLALLRKGSTSNSNS